MAICEARPTALRRNAAPGRLAVGRARGVSSPVMQSAPRSAGRAPRHRAPIILEPTWRREKAYHAEAAARHLDLIIRTNGQRARERARG